MSSTATETDVFEQIKDDITPVCEYIEVFISNHDFKPTAFGKRCQSAAEWSGMIHSIRSHERRLSFMCDVHMNEFLHAVCPNPVCCAPRMTNPQRL
jgi:hypothetical protein